jgi:adenine-specific DNA-methyltransferase
MARKKRSTKKQETEVQDYRHDDASRKNNPPAGIASHGRVHEQPKQEYAYNPHLPPSLQFDGNGDADQLPELLAKAQQGPLSADEVQTLAAALKHHGPWLEWAGKQEAESFAVDPVALHIHERVSAKAIVKIAERENVQRELFADPQQEYREAVQFYQHDVDWTNRLILGDSLTVMSSLAQREDLAGKVQMIYIDPPYGIKFASNFQPTVFQRDVKEKESDLTREREQIKAYRDTWTLGVHSYLAYLRDRLIVAKDLLTDSGSIFVQIGDENVHRVRCIMDEVFGAENFIALIPFQTTTGLQSRYLKGVYDLIIWYAKKRENMKYKQLYLEKQTGADTYYDYVKLPDGSIQKVQENEEIPDNWQIFSPQPLVSGTYSETTTFEFPHNSTLYHPGGNRCWKTTPEGMKRLSKSERIFASAKTLKFIRYANDFLVTEVSNLWTDAMSLIGKKYVAETVPKIIERCMLMVTEPGDLILDPTCGSGTTAYVAEQWGRRWITIDTSRVAITLARQKLLTANFNYYQLKNKLEGVSGGFVNKTVPYITLKSIAQNTALDPIFAKHESILEEKLEILNLALTEVTPKIRTKLLSKLAEKERRDGKKAITDADRRRWQLPTTAWQEWEVPFDPDPDWPQALSDALTDYREAFRAKMEEVNDCIAASSEGEELVDQPEVDSKKLRVSGPFTVEAVQPAEASLDTDSPISGEPEEEMDTFESDNVEGKPTNAEAYLDQMIRLLKNDGVRFPDDQKMKFATLDLLEDGILHAEGIWEGDDVERNVAVVFGPQHGPVTAMQVEECLPIASRRGYDELIFAGFSFDGTAQAIIRDDPNPRVRIHIAHINPDVTMGDLLKETPSSQLFTVFGSPRTEIETTVDGEYIVKMEGVDIYNPVENTVSSAGGDKVAAWFIDSDYDSRTFCITQAFFPDKKAWDKIARALKSVIDSERFEKFSGTESLPFPAGEHQRVAVKVIDPRGNEVMRVHDLRETGYA